MRAFLHPLLLGETLFTRVEIGRVRRLGTSIHVQFRFCMWADGRAVETYRSEQHAIFSSPDGIAP
jgi:acyl dehydratase